MNSDRLAAPADIPQKSNGRIVSKLMYMIWQSRKDLQNTFDLHSAEGQSSFIDWCSVSIGQEHGGSTEANGADQQQGNSSSGLIRYQTIMQMEGVLAKIGTAMPMGVREFGRRIWKAVVRRLLAHQASRVRVAQTPPTIATPELADSTPAAPLGTTGYNLIGHAFAELGMGEHVRMSAASLATTDVAFGVINYEHGLLSRKGAELEHGDVVKENSHKINVFHINADQLLNSYLYYGDRFFSGKYNILYPFWELSKWPQQWVSVLDIVDEVWAPTKFIEDAMAPAIDRPVVHMPVAVTLPETAGNSRSYFNLPSGRFLFLFTFDSFSFIERKNPFAIVRAFRKAFPLGTEAVGLVIKSMNATTSDPRWQDMINLIGADQRIHVINRTMTRHELIDLFKVTDCFVSLHRAEGFGRGPAEAMLLGKPTIVTNYSGNLEFCNDQNSCLVDYRLIPIEEHQYVMPTGQVWADPDEDHAAWYMSKLVNESAYATMVGAQARDYMLKNFSAEVIGQKYRARLAELGI